MAHVHLSTFPCQDYAEAKLPPGRTPASFSAAGSLLSIPPREIRVPFPFKDNLNLMRNTLPLLKSSHPLRLHV